MSSTPTRNPFLMMTNPELILRAVERSVRLNRLDRHVCRPLDRPLIPKTTVSGVDAFDSAIDSESDLVADSF